MSSTSEPASPPPAEPRDAASLIVMRQEARGLTLLMGRRNAGHRFMPNVLVFPGGAVDAADYTAPVALPLPAQTRARLERSAEPALAQALAVAAARELYEEVGLSLGDPPALDGLDYLCRAITPPSQSIRFDARFFVVDGAHVSGVMAGSREIEAPGWYTIEEARAGKLALATLAVLGVFERWLGLAERGGMVPVLRDRGWAEE